MVNRALKEMYDQYKNRCRNGSKGYQETYGGEAGEARRAEEASIIGVWHQEEAERNIEGYESSEDW